MTGGWKWWRGSIRVQLSWQDFQADLLYGRDAGAEAGSAELGSPPDGDARRTELSPPRR